MKKQTTTVVPVQRAIIEGKLLTALDAENTCAILVTRKDLDFLIEAIEGQPLDVREDRSDFLVDLRRLRQECFS